MNSAGLLDEEEIMRKMVAAAFGVVLSLWLIGSPLGAWGEETHQVIIQDFSFKPPKLTIKAGDSIRFINEDYDAHTATEDAKGGFDAGHLDRKAVRTVTFEEPGVYPYGCSYHPAMEAVIEVTP